MVQKGLNLADSLERGVPKMSSSIPAHERRRLSQPLTSMTGPKRGRPPSFRTNENVVTKAIKKSRHDPNPRLSFS
eukprot:CAMPEP_0172375914 /NCGR_PEP_ID=MMETSP1060-20121228/64108_1 /TAXON_ID=37318 /ORGANISM="Pseudo-nitzschia pungens, Strain cf. cingulata" /LENGTH=74 /DNA_ID=CAMNT_0013103235 /DNA_START=158 /DNA_END=378 /DNA_ORIENTATION=+